MKPIVSLFLLSILLVSSSNVSAQRVPRGNVTELGLMGRKDVTDHLKKEYDVSEETIKKAQAVLKQATQDAKDAIAEMRRKSREEGPRLSRDGFFDAIRMEGKLAFEKAWEEKLKSSFTEKQQKRIFALKIQLLGLFALSDASVQKRLELNKDQIKKLNEIRNEYDEQTQIEGKRTLRNVLGVKDKEERKAAAAEATRVLEAMNRKMADDSMAVLNESQRDKLKQLKGAPLEFVERRPFGGK